MSDPQRPEDDPDVVPSEAGDPNRDRAYLQHQPPAQDRTGAEGRQAEEDAEPSKGADQ